MSYFIVLEGLDGSGKSTLARKLAELLTAHLLSTPLKSLVGVRAEVDQVFNQSNRARSLWYSAHVQCASEQIRGLLSQGHNVVLDRYWLSTCVYAKEDLQWELLLEHLLTPTCTVFLDVPRELRASRLHARGARRPGRSCGL